MRRIVAPKLCSRKNNSCVRANKEWPSTRPNSARCGKRLRDCGRSAWLATRPTRRHRPPTGRVSRNTAKHPKRACCRAPLRPCKPAAASVASSIGSIIEGSSGLTRVEIGQMRISSAGKGASETYSEGVWLDPNSYSFLWSLGCANMSVGPTCTAMPTRAPHTSIRGTGFMECQGGIIPA